MHFKLTLISFQLAPISCLLRSFCTLRLVQLLRKAPHILIWCYGPSPQATSSAQYIIQQYICATGVLKLGNVQNLYAMGRVKMLASEFEAAAAATIHMAKAKSSWRAAESGCFVLWQMAPDMWNVEMVVGGSKVVAGSDGQLI